MDFLDIFLNFCSSFEQLFLPELKTKLNKVWFKLKEDFRIKLRNQLQKELNDINDKIKANSTKVDLLNSLNSGSDEVKNKVATLLTENNNLLDVANEKKEKLNRLG